MWVVFIPLGCVFGMLVICCLCDMHWECGSFVAFEMCIENVGHLLHLRCVLGIWVICCLWGVYLEFGSYVAFEVCIWNVGHMLPFEPETSKVRYIMWYWYYTVWSQYFLIHLSYIYTTSTSITKIWKYKKKLLWNLMLCFDMKTMLCLLFKW